MASLIVVTGPPGAGKSTVAQLVAAAFETAVLVPGDDFFGFWTRGYVEPWLPEAREQNELVVRAAAAACGTFARGGCTAVYDGFLDPGFLPAFHAATGLPGLHYAALLPPLAECLDRVSGRIGHGFTDPTATAHMHADFAAAPLNPRHVISTADDDPAAVARSLLRRHREGELRYPT
ncbi:hypothetical protein [Modestobacter sp. VKM Ac-2978]|uniref:hypothetical protein n=1 Tax=Modestobacter sp. VKM Ac-2978 TaxID=3004132 RepID=UPI0022AB0C1B|nr:hypothetical protein [Modestobacter sp. VKM Ac-2978]MCZ2850348.1 hypothetical protein [Modestobacter sp. VKM Ac-2978]